MTRIIFDRNSKRLDVQKKYQNGHEMRIYS